MDILKTAIDWTKAEMLSSAIFVLFGVAFVLASYGFWNIGKTGVARAYVIPTLIAGALLLVLGLGLFFLSQARVSGFAAAHASDAAAFVAAEIERADRVLNEYRVAVFRVIPIMISVSALLIIFLNSPIWRASLITAIAMLAVILMIDTNASARLEIYKDKLTAAAGGGA